MKGGSRQTRKREPKQTTTVEVASDTVSSQVMGESNASCNSPVLRTPKRGRRRKGQPPKAHLTSTPVRSSSTAILSNISKSPTGEKQVEQACTELFNQLKTSEVDSPSCQSKSQITQRRPHASQPKQVRKGRTKGKTKTCSLTNSPPAKRRQGTTQNVETEDLQKDSTIQSSKRCRPRFELKKPDSAEQDESLLSSDLSIELSQHEEQLPCGSFQEDEGSDEDEELPSFLMQEDKKPPSITGGVFVWHKYRNYPFWPALVKSVNSKQKKASIIFIDGLMIHKKKGFTVALKTLKCFDCEETNVLVSSAKEEYHAAIEWSLELITDYRIRIACGSFSGSFIQYFAHDMSYPVRRKYPQAASEQITITRDTMNEMLCDDQKDDSLGKQHEEVSRSSKRLLPDRTHAAHNRANEKLVHFIVKQRMVEEHLLAVIRGQQQSRWLRSFLNAKRRRVVNIYLEDDQQLDEVYRYLNELYATAVTIAPCLTEMKSLERVPFVLDVLLPEAIINAIAGVDNVPVEKAEEKYLKGRCISTRERQEFDLMIEQHMRKKSQHQNTSLALISDPIS